MADEPFAECDVCKKSFSGPEPYSEHLASKSHEKKMVESRKNMKYAPLPPDESGDTGKLRCNVCDVSLTGEKSMKQHESGSKHLNNLKKQNIMATIKSENDGVDHSDVLKCEVCQKSFSGPESFQQHLKSKKHVRKIELAAMKSQLNGGVPPSCPPATEANSNKESTNFDPTIPAGRLYPQLGDDYNIVHQEIQNSRNMAIEDKKKVGCFPSFKKVFKKKEKAEKADKKNKQ